MKTSIEERLDRAVELYFAGYSAKEAIEGIRHELNIDENAEIYSEETGQTYKDIEAMTDEEIKKLVEG